jgi:ABC-2 type transport system permease protein
MNRPQTEISRIFIRVSAFLLKEMLEIARQPMLLVTLVLGPFLILLFFGIGFRNEPQSLRTLFVMPNGSPLAERIEQYATSLGRQLIFEGITSDEAEARARLAAGQVDLVVVVPPDPFDTIRANQQAVFELQHRQINPIQADYVSVFGRVYVDEVNRRILRYITAAGQVDVDKIDTTLDIVRANIEELKTALNDCADALAELGESASCNSDALNTYVREVDQNIDEVRLQLKDTPNLSDSTQRWLNGETSVNAETDLEPALNRIIRETNNLADFDEIQQTTDNYISQVQSLARLESDLDVIRTRLAEFAGINPQILVSPFRSQVTNVATIGATVTDYYAPAVIMMLLQHLTVTFAALSLVRERLLGSVEVFTVSPISALETLLGKYLSYLIFGGLLSLVLFGLIVAGMKVPLLGGGGAVALTVLAVIFSSLGIGFVISMVSTTDTQAVQYSMIVLLTSVFFSGFILELHTLWEPVRTISWLLPVTYGILLLRDIMLRGYPINPALLWPLLTIGVALFALAWWLLRRSMKQL